MKKSHSWQPETSSTRSGHWFRSALLFLAILSCSGNEAIGPGTPGPPASLEILAGQDQPGVVGIELPTPLRVKVLDASGNPVKGQIVNFRVTSGDGSMFAGSSITSDSGTAVDRWTLGTLVTDSQRVEARAIDPNTGEKLVFGVFRATANHGAPAAIAKVEGDAQTGAAGSPLKDSLAVRVVDRYGNPASALTVNWSVPVGSGALSTAANQTNALGIARAQWTLGTSTSEPHQATASIDTVTPVQFTVIVAPAAATQLLLRISAQGAVISAPFATAPSVHIADSFGNTVTSANDLVTLTVSSGASVIGTAAVNAVNGIALFSTAGLTGSAGAYTLTYTSTLGAGQRTVTQSLALVPGAAIRYIITSSASNAIVGTPVTITAQLSDASGAPVSAGGNIITWSRSGAGGSFGNATSTTNVSGLATVSFTVDTVDGTTATITATDNNSFSGSTSVSTVAGAAAKLAFDIGPSTTGWRILINPAVVVAVQDRYSNPVTSGTPAVTLSIGVNPGSATLSGGESTPAIGGIATYSNVVLDQPGSGYSLTASSAGLTSVTSSPFDVSSIGVLTTCGDIYTGCGGVQSLAVSGSSVYFTRSCVGPMSSGCGIAAVATTGGTFTILEGVGQLSTYGGRLITDGTYVNILRVAGFHTRGGYIRRVPVAGGTSSFLPVASGGSSSGPDFEFDGAYFYMNWSPPPYDTDTYGIGRTRASDGASQVLVGRTRPAAYPFFAIAGGQLYYVDSTASGSTIQKESVDSGPSTTVVTGLGPLTSGYPWRKMLVVDNTIYWVERGNGGTTDGLIRSAPISGGVATTRATGLSPTAGNLVSDGTYLYVNDGGSLRRFKLSDFSVVTIAANDSVIDIALDSQAVYWASSNVPGSIKKAPK